MLQFYHKRSWRALVYSPFMVAFLLVLIGCMVTAAYARYQMAVSTADRQRALEDEYRKIQERREEISSKVTYLSNDRGIEAEVRRNFDVAKPGEKVVVILDDDADGGLIEPLPQLPPPPPPRWYEFWRW